MRCSCVPERATPFLLLRHHPSDCLLREPQSVRPGRATDTECESCDAL